MKQILLIAIFICLYIFNVKAQTNPLLYINNAFGKTVNQIKDRELQQPDTTVHSSLIKEERFENGKYCLVFQEDIEFLGSYVTMYYFDNGKCDCVKDLIKLRIADKIYPLYEMFTQVKDNLFIDKNTNIVMSYHLNVPDKTLVWVYTKQTKHI